jgi:hypothetical protein
MWWAFIVGLVFAYPIVEMVEEWRQRRSSIKDLSMMRKHIQFASPMGCKARSMDVVGLSVYVP